MTHWYRVEDFRWAPPLDEWDTPIGSSRADIRVLGFPVLKFTTKGVWLSTSGGKRFVLRYSKKRFACPTEEEAFESFFARKKRQLKLLRGQIVYVKEALELAKRLHSIH